MPAFVKSRFGESGMRLDDGTIVCCFDLKKSRNDWRIWVLVLIIILSEKAAHDAQPPAAHQHRSTDAIFQGLEVFGAGLFQLLELPETYSLRGFFCA
jgi:hypothetical protein